MKLIYRCVSQRILLTSCILIDKTLFLIAFYQSFNVCIYCNYDNLGLLAFIVHLLITFFTLFECAAEILLDFSKTYHHNFLLKP